MPSLARFFAGALAFGMLTLRAVPAIAQDPSGLTAAALDAFYGACLTESFEIRKIESFISTLDWQELDPQTLELFKSEGAVSYFRGWIAKSPWPAPIGWSGLNLSA
ncbi:hypothetical protein AKL17_4323 [Frigidibacter mobilis]|uniref:Uncharacterized protein n=1 Tax=Frigidibacter mobilis TaxID=1335048 RepID=A0A159Z7T2_9RHOB|nr:hypothetical protein AKL17_4323 [Frigidibacter mobilis]